MARKGILDDLMNGAGDPATASPQAPRRTGGAIGVVSRSIADLKSRSVVEIDPQMVDDAGLKDRLDGAEDDLDGLVESIRDYGQQVPVLVRVNPNYPERYQVVYGRRRVAAMKRLQLPVKALVRDLDDRALIMAQGQENTARKDLSFIEKVNFARQMRDAKYDRKVICDALNMDKTLISRMLQIADAVPVRLIEAIGAAPSIGRDRWMALAGRLDGRDLSGMAVGDSSDARFETVMAAATPPRRATAHAATALSREDGISYGQIQRRGSKLVVTLDSRSAQGFDDWLAENIDRIRHDWINQSGE